MRQNFIKKTDMKIAAPESSPEGRYSIKISNSLMIQSVRAFGHPLPDLNCASFYDS